MEDKVKSLAGMENSDMLIKDLNMWILNVFYITPYNDVNFFDEVYRRMKLTESKFLEEKNEK